MSTHMIEAAVGRWFVSRMYRNSPRVVHLATRLTPKRAYFERNGRENYCHLEDDVQAWFDTMGEATNWAAAHDKMDSVARTCTSSASSCLRLAVQDFVALAMEACSKDAQAELDSCADVLATSSGLPVETLKRTITEPRFRVF